MASNPPAECCTKGFKHEGSPTGQSIKIGNHDGYLATPAENRQKSNTGILYIPDILGLWQNAKLLADQFALHGYTTLIVEPFNGDPIKVNEFPGVDLQDWIKHGRNGAGPHTTKEVDPIIKEALAYLKDNLGVQKIGAVGYCFGAKYVARHYHSGIQVGFMAHPSFVEEDELAAITGPLSIAASEVDEVFPPEKRALSEEILREGKKNYQINLFSGVSHGFAVRCNLEDKIQRVAKEQAFKQAVDFFDNWLE